MRCAVVGAGAWGTALADLLARNGHDVALWAREPEVIASVNASHENSMFLAGAKLHVGVVAHAELDAACSRAELVLFAPSVPSVIALFSRDTTEVTTPSALWACESAELALAVY